MSCLVYFDIRSLLCAENTSVNREPTVCCVTSFLRYWKPTSAADPIISWRWIIVTERARATGEDSYFVSSVQAV